VITGCELIYLAQRHRSQTTYNFDLLPHSPASGPSACSVMAVGLLNLLLKAADCMIVRTGETFSMMTVSGMGDALRERL